MSRVKAGNLRLGEASELLELSYRQAKRIWARDRVGGGKARGGRRPTPGAGPVPGGGNGRGGGGGVGWWARAPGGAGASARGREEAAREAAHRGGAGGWGSRRDPVRAHVREAGHSHYR